jgi:hypothetical protein
MDNDDPHSRPERAEEEDERGFATDLLAHIDARRQAEEARTRALLAALTAAVEPEPQDDHPDDHEEAA